jgi:hypothetical protein
MLKPGWADCKNWNMFAVLAGREGQAAKPKVNVREQAKKKAQFEVQRTAAIGQFQQYLAAGHPAAALTLHRKMTEADAGWQLRADAIFSATESVAKIPIPPNLSLSLLKSAFAGFTAPGLNKRPPRDCAFFRKVPPHSAETKKFLSHDSR